MGLKTILVVLSSREHAETLMKAAVPLARKHQAHLIGLHAMEALMVYPGVAMHVPGTVYAQFNKNQRVSAEEIEKVFEGATKAEEFPSEWRLIKAEHTSSATRILESARAADLILMAQERRTWERPDHLDEELRTIRESGRPVIVIPQGYDGPEIGQHILLGWSDTREATRAAHDVLALSPPDAQLDILRISSPGDEMEDHSTIEIAKAFDRHGLSVEVIQRTRGPHTIAEMLQHEATEKGADLIAVGAFGHSRLYDFAVGAVSYELLRNAELPVLFSK